MDDSTVFQFCSSPGSTSLIGAQEMLLDTWTVSWWPTRRKANDVNVRGSSWNCLACEMETVFIKVHFFPGMV